jgi:hypothetical protein
MGHRALVQTFSVRHNHFAVLLVNSASKIERCASIPAALNAQIQTFE